MKKRGYEYYMEHHCEEYLAVLIEMTEEMARRMSRATELDEREFASRVKRKARTRKKAE